MRAAERILWLWPGLPQLWYGGGMSGLVLAIVFALLLNVAILATFVWPELLSPPVRMLAWAAAAILCLVSAALASRHGSGLNRPADERDLFQRGQAEYLQGNWYQAEALLQQLLRRNPRDIEARLMLATLLRHARRLDDAKAQLRLLQRWERSSAWKVEIENEWERLERLRAETDSPLQALPGESPRNKARAA